MIHLATKVHVSPVALDAMFWKKQGCNYPCLSSPYLPVITKGGTWLPAILLHCWPMEFQDHRIIILNECCDKAQVFQHNGSSRNERKDIVLRKFGDCYTLLEIQKYDWEKFVFTHIEENSVECCEGLNSMAVTEICLPKIRGVAVANESNLRSMWECAIKDVNLTQDLFGRWTSKPSGLSSEKRFQDGSLQDSGWKHLKDEIYKHCPTDKANVVDFGSEGGYCLAQFAIDPRVHQVTGIEIQYPWAVYSLMILCSIHIQSTKQSTHFAKTTLFCGSFLNLSDDNWKNAIQTADIIHCDNENWCKSNLPIREAVIPPTKDNSDLRKSTDSNVAFTLRRHAKSTALLICYKAEHFVLGFQTKANVKVLANWNSFQHTTVCILQIQEMQLLVVADKNAKTCSQRNHFACNCGMIFIFRERLLVDDIYLCKTCHVHNIDVL
jgi:hypothetical protein